MLTIHKLLNILRAEDNKTMTREFSQLVEYKMRIIVLKKCTRNIVEKLVPNFLMKIQKIFASTASNVVMLVMSKSRSTEVY